MKKIIIVMLFILIILIIFPGCGSLDRPERQDFKSAEAYNLQFCLYINQKNPDKTICNKFGLEYSKAVTQQRIYDRIEYCRKNRPDKWTFDMCYDKTALRR
jgi:hypothetical protein